MSCSKIIEIENTIVNKKIEVMVNELMTCGAYGAKVLGAGGGGFIFAIGSFNKSLSR